MRNHAWIGRLGALLALGIGAAACGSDGTGDDGTDGAGDGGDGSPSDGSPTDGSPSDGSPTDGSQTDGTDGPMLCGVMDTVCEGETPVCFNGQCVECTLADHAACASGQVCNPATHRCDSANTPFALDCANLPTDGACQGGPREVLLVTEKSGIVLMFDPGDGHYLGVFKRAVPNFEGSYWTATQGPDQCIWTSGQGDALGVERWNPDGSFKDEIIPRATYYAGTDDIVQSVLSLAFTKDDVYVASTQGDPHARLTRFHLEALPAPASDPDPESRYEVVIDDGTEVGSLIVLGDGSLVTSSEVPVDASSEHRLEWRAADGTGARPLYEAFESFYGPTQVSYAGDGRVIAGDSWNGTLFSADIATGEGTDPIEPFESRTSNLYGTYQLGDGRWLYAGPGVVEALDPAATNPPGKHTSLFTDKAIGSVEFRYVGRACLSNEFVESRSTPDAAVPVGSCDDVPAGAELLAETFDEGDFETTPAGQAFHDFVVQDIDGVSVTLDDTLDADGTGRSLKIAGADPAGGVIRELANLKPSYIGYYFRVNLDGNSEEHYTGYFSLNDWPSGSLDAVYSSWGDIGTFQSFVDQPAVAKNSWVRIQMRDIDWTDRTYDLYVDCERVGDDIAFSPHGGPDIARLALFNNYFGGDTPVATSWFDDIVMK